MTKQIQPPRGYAVLLKEIKERVRTAQVHAAFAVSRELISVVLVDRTGHFAPATGRGLGDKGH
jgi:hypothetical protein